MSKNIAVITGANNGFGKEFVKLIIAKPEIDEVWTIARNQEKLDSLRQEFGEKIRTFSIDLSNRENITAFASELTDDVCIKYLVNNAGYAKFCTYSDLSVNDSLNMIDLNVSAVVAMGLVCIPHMQRGSRIINIASQSAFFPLPYLNVYGSTKAFVRNYTRALNVELKEKGISATAVCPGWMDTGLFDRGNIGSAKGITNFSGMVSPNVVAAKAMRDADKGRDISVYSLYVKSTHLLSKVLPQRMLMKVWLGQQGMR